MQQHGYHRRNIARHNQLVFTKSATLISSHDAIFKERNSSWHLWRLGICQPVSTLLTNRSLRTVYRRSMWSPEPARTVIVAGAWRHKARITFLGDFPGRKQQQEKRYGVTFQPLLLSHLPAFPDNLFINRLELKTISRKPCIAGRVSWKEDTVRFV